MYPLEDEYNTMQPSYVNTLHGTTSKVTPIAKSTPITQETQVKSKRIRENMNGSLLR